MKTTMQRRREIEQTCDISSWSATTFLFIIHRFRAAMCIFSIDRLPHRPTEITYRRCLGILIEFLVDF